MYDERQRRSTKRFLPIVPCLLVGNLTLERLGCDYNIIQIFVFGTCMHWGDQTNQFALCRSGTIFLCLDAGQPTMCWLLAVLRAM